MVEKVVKKLILLNKSVSTMESCTGGAIANAITNIPDASMVFSFSAVTYANEYKIKMGVDKNVIEKYSVYSIETAKEMSKAIAKYSSSSYGIGITGKLNKHDEKNPYGSDNIVYISIYDKENDKFYNKEVTVLYTNRIKNKKMVLNEVFSLMYGIIK